MKLKLKRVYKNWGVHNMVAHPLMQICTWLGAKKLAVLVHNKTLPEERVIEGITYRVGQVFKIKTHRAQSFREVVITISDFHEKEDSVEFAQFKGKYFHTQFLVDNYDLVE